jgi:hypothetical protein
MICLELYSANQVQTIESPQGQSTQNHEHRDRDSPRKTMNNIESPRGQGKSTQNHERHENEASEKSNTDKRKAKNDNQDSRPLASPTQVRSHARSEISSSKTISKGSTAAADAAAATCCCLICGPALLEHKRQSLASSTAI